MAHHLHETLLREIKKKIPKGPEMVRVLVELLSIEKVAVYRRLRSEVPFSLEEATIIAKNLSISLDELIGIDLEQSKTFRIKLPDFVYPTDDDHHMFFDFIDFFESISLMEDTETGVVTNALPQEFFSNFEAITKFIILRWQYYYDYERKNKFKDLPVSTLVLDTFKKQFIFSKNFKKTYYLFDRRIFIRFIKEIDFFKNIRLLDDESIKEIKAELLLLVDYMENIATTGEFPETRNKVYIYITDMEVPYSCAYIKANDIEYTLLKAYILTSITSFDKTVYKQTKEWIYASIKTSTCITETFEIQRIEFFEEQRNVINVL